MKKVIKLKESELKNILENILLKEENNNYNPFEDPKANALVNFLIDDQEIEVGFAHIIPLKYDHYGLSMYKVKDREYAVGTDEEADYAYKQHMENLIDDVGIGIFNQSFVMNYIDSEWFEDVLREHLESYIENIRDESTDDDQYENRLQEEMAESNVETEDEFLEHLIDNAGDPVEYFKDNFGEKEFSEMVEQNNLIDSNALIEGAKNADGRGDISSWDSIENEYGDYYIYRIN